MATYHIWTVGCQFNKADAENLSASLERRGYLPVGRPEEADIVVVNSCVVRQHAEDRVTGKLDSLRYLKRQRDVTIALMGCMVGPQTEDLKRRFPHVDLFLRPGQFQSLLEVTERHVPPPEEREFPPITKPAGITAFVPIIEGCDKFCTYCIVPLRRGRERSRPVSDVVAEVEGLVARGTREVTLLGQTVDSYGHDLPDRPDLAELLCRLNDVQGLCRIRFLTSYPNDLTPRIIAAMASLSKVCEHINLPVQAGDDAVLAAMGRNYSVAHYRKLVASIRRAIPQVALSTDIIVGFPGESEEQFQHTYDLLAELRFDTVHVAAYSPRPGTRAARTLPDDVPPAEKSRRLQAVEVLQEGVAKEINTRLLGQEMDVLVEGRRKGKWEGRTRTNKLVFFTDGQDRLGQLVTVKVQKASAWALQGEVGDSEGAQPL